MSAYSGPAKQNGSLSTARIVVLQPRLGDKCLSGRKKIGYSNTMQEQMVSDLY